MKQPLIQVENLAIVPAGCAEQKVRGLSFSLDAGRSLILLGESGCGKTLTCRAITGGLDAGFRVSGRILFGGEDLLALSEKRLSGVYGREIALIMQNPMTAFNPSARIGGQMTRTIRLHTGLRRGAAKEKCAAALREAGLDDPERVMRAHPSMLSGGMLQRAMIAMALALDARLIVADEPTTALDVAHRCEVVDALCRLRKRGAAVLFVTHDFAVARRMGGEMMIMKDGRILERGTVEAVLREPRAEYTRALVAASRLRCAADGGLINAGSDCG